LARKIIVASSKGGAGKSTASLGIASALVEKGKKVLLCDLDFENKCLEFFMGLEEVSLYNIADVAKGLVSADKAVIRNEKGLSFITAPTGYTVSAGRKEKNVTPAELAYAIKEVIKCEEPDYVIFDTAAGHSIPVILASKFRDAHAIVTASHQPASCRGAQRAAEYLEENGVKNVRLVITGYEFDEAWHKVRSGIIEIIDSSSVQLLGVVPYDRVLMLSHERGTVVPKNSISSIAFSNIASRLDGDNVRLFDGMKNIKRNRIL